MKKGLRGKSYFDELKQYLAKCGQNIIDDANEMRPLTLLNLGELSKKYDLNFKATCEWLEESQILPTGTYDIIIERGFKVKDLGVKNET